jgi:membrane protein
LLVSLVVHATLTAFVRFFDHYFEKATVVLLQIVNFIVPLAVITLLFVMIFKFLPDVKIKWKDVWIGAFVTALLFTAGKFLIGVYLGNSDISSVYGAAGTVIIILVWVFYSSILLFLGAEFTQVYIRSHGYKIEPTEYAVKIEKKIIEKK